MLIFISNSGEASVIVKQHKKIVLAQCVFEQNLDKAGTVTQLEFVVEG